MPEPGGDVSLRATQSPEVGEGGLEESDELNISTTSHSTPLTTLALLLSADEERPRFFSNETYLLFGYNALLLLGKY